MKLLIIGNVFDIIVLLSQDCVLYLNEEKVF